MFGILSAVAVLATSYLLTRFTLVHSEQLRLIDMPNERSSHTRPTARGGGAAIALASLLAIALSMFCVHAESKAALAVLSAGSLVAVIGFWDDRRSLSPAVRLAGQLLAACLLVYFLGLPRRIDLGLLRIDSAYLAAFLVVIGVVWLINLANFMDGIDGLAGAECVFVMATRSALLYWCGDRGATYIGFAVAAAALGFLFLNWSPARIFMGDVGSGYIGLLYAALMLSDTIANPSGLWVWLILLAAFLVDSTVTLIRRLKAGQRVWQAHRTHAYQNAALRWGHARTTVAFILVDIFWLAPLAFCAAKWHNLGSSLFVVATAPLVAIVWRLGAGVQKTAAPGKVPYLDLISAALLRE